MAKALQWQMVDGNGYAMAYSQWQMAKASRWQMANGR
jgi:hypothetical protein